MTRNHGSIRCPDCIQCVECGLMVHLNKPLMHGLLCSVRTPSDEDHEEEERRKFPVRLIQMVDGCMVRHDFGPEVDLIAAMAVRGYDYKGPNTNRSQRAELQGQPKFSGLNGPMWDGDALRYEDPKSYAALSE